MKSNAKSGIETGIHSFVNREIVINSFC